MRYGAALKVVTLYGVRQTTASWYRRTPTKRATFAVSRGPERDGACHDGPSSWHPRRVHLVVVSALSSLVAVLICTLLYRCLRKKSVPSGISTRRRPLWSGALHLTSFLARGPNLRWKMAPNHQKTIIFEIPQIKFDGRIFKDRR